jgi:GH25 family lysozyme M1 (1,4-beta-N-acetylmuramidase)
MARYNGKRVSRPWQRLLRAAERDRGRPINLTSGRRTMAEQWRLYRANMIRPGVPRPGRPLTAFPSPIAPHIRVGRDDHALDIDRWTDAEWFDQWTTARGLPLTNTVAGEPWHKEAPNARALRRAAKKYGPAPTPPSGVREGVDVSMHQGDVDWGAIGSACDFAFMKATEGLTFVDSRFDAERVRQARRAVKVIGFYHFARPQAGRTGAEEALFFVRIVKSRGGAKKGDLRLALDLEDTKLGVEGTHKFAEDFCDKVHALTGENAIVYTGPSFWNEKVGGKPAPRHGKALWIAHYGVDRPDVPRGWSDWRIWQYTSSGSCPGVNGRCDMNKFRGSRADLEALRLG